MRTTNQCGLRAQSSPPTQIAAWTRGRHKYRAIKLRRLSLTAQYLCIVIGGNFCIGQTLCAINRGKRGWRRAAAGLKGENQYEPPHYECRMEGAHKVKMSNERTLSSAELLHSIVVHMPSFSRAGKGCRQLVTDRW